MEKKLFLAVLLCALSLSQATVYQIGGDVTSLQSGNGTVASQNITFNHRFPSISANGTNSSVNYSGIHTVMLGAWFNQDFVAQAVAQLLAMEIFTEEDLENIEIKTVAGVSLIAMGVFTLYWVKPAIAVRRKKKEIFIYQPSVNKP